MPASGLPVLFLADHPVTGGYPVLGVVLHADLDRAAQLGTGARIRFAAVALEKTVPLEKSVPLENTVTRDTGRVSASDTPNES